MNTGPMVSREMYDLVRRELEPGEKIEWYEQPVPRYFSPGTLGKFLFAIPWTAFTFFWTAGAAGFKMPDFSQGIPSLFPLFGLPFILIGLGMLSAPLRSHRRAFKTIYAITDKRAMIITDGRTRTVQSLLPESFTRLIRKEKRDGTGHILYEDGGTDGDGNVVTDVLFMDVRDPREVEGLLKSLAERNRAANRMIESS
ncbi:MAG: hypothetical protein HZB23_06440 [Deltaproteobacteria bacterium]|nr:hypothetical protein [Deltaproteobacteria bacterium]